MRRQTSPSTTPHGREADAHLGSGNQRILQNIGVLSSTVLRRRAVAHHLVAVSAMVPDSHRAAVGGDSGAMAVVGPLAREGKAQARARACPVRAMAHLYWTSTPLSLQPRRKGVRSWRHHARVDVTRPRPDEDDRKANEPFDGHLLAWHDGEFVQCLVLVDHIRLVRLSSRQAFERLVCTTITSVLFVFIYHKIKSLILK